MLLLFIVLTVVALSARSGNSTDRPGSRRSTDAAPTTSPVQLTDLTASSGENGTIRVTWKQIGAKDAAYFLVRDGEKQVARAESYQSDVSIDGLYPTSDYELSLVAFDGDDHQIASEPFPRVRTTAIVETFQLQNGDVKEMRGGMLIVATAPPSSIVATQLVLNIPPASCTVDNLSVNQSSVAWNPQTDETLVITVTRLEPFFTDVMVMFTREAVKAPVQCFAQGA